MIKRKTGFTLIELVIAIAIGMMVVGFGAVSLNNFYEKQKVETTSQELLSALILARNYAITNQLPADSPVGTDRVTVTIDNDGLMIIKTQKNDNTDAGYIFTSRDITPKGIIINTPIIRFNVTDGRSIGGTANIIINGGVGVTKNIRIDESGLIYEK